MSEIEESVACESFKELENIARDGCEGTPYFVEGSIAGGHFIVHTPANDSVLLTCEQDGSEIAITVAVYPPDRKHVIYSHSYIPTAQGLQHPTHKNILLTPKEAMNSAFRSFDGRLQVS
jgi:hypothetical protein